MYCKRMERDLNRVASRWDSHASAQERSRRERWSAPGKARVVHPTRGTVVVPCRSPFAAMLCAAEVWRCNWMEIRDAKVWRADPGDQVAAMPHII